MSAARFFLLVPVFLLACEGEKPEDEGTTPGEDADGDGYAGDADCDDADPAVHPDAAEDCDGQDDNCDGQVDEGATSAFYLDADGDGYGSDSAAPAEGCAAPAGYVGQAGDCDDTDFDYYPGAPEDDCADPSDYNCDGSVAFADADDDGFAACEECDDADPATNPGASEICDDADNDCDGRVDAEDEDLAGAGLWYADGDGDGYGDEDGLVISCDQPAGTVADKTDCDDADAAANPGESEVCDGADNDCDGDEDEDGAAGASTFYADDDNDGFGDPGDSALSCEMPGGYVADGTDCDDGDGDAFPGNDETCDGDDDDCDGATDEDSAIDVDTWYLDGDSDGYGDPAVADIDCDKPPGYVASSADCDDSDPGISPADAEVAYDGIDQNCSGADLTDVDGDGYAGLAAGGDDCDDGEPAVNPGETEVCDELDNDCDAEADEGATTTYYRDDDADTYGLDDDTVQACALPAGYAADGGDCDDGDGASNPGASEVCDEADNDCDAATDEGVTSLYYADEDADGYGDAEAEAACAPPAGYAAVSGDCDPADPAVNPAAVELCNGVDDDCDGLTDTEVFYPDADGDGYGDGALGAEACGQPEGYVGDGTDCDDASAAIHPGAEETCDGVDEDCDGEADASDGTPLCNAGSCLDWAASYPGADGLYEIDPDGDGLDVVEVYCDMTTDGGGWTLISWTGNSAVSPYGVPYPGLSVCPTQDCLRGSAAETDVLNALLELSAEVGIGHTTSALASYQNLGDYTYAGAFDYGSLSGLYLDPGHPVACGAGFAIGTFHTLAGPTTYEGATAYLAQSFRYYSSAASYNDFSDGASYIWNIGAPNYYCDGTGTPPGTWLGSWSANEYGPYLASTAGARSVWLR